MPFRRAAKPQHSLYAERSSSGRLIVNVVPETASVPAVVRRAAISSNVVHKDRVSTFTFPLDIEWHHHLAVCSFPERNILEVNCATTDQRAVPK